jgi:hypothetical protein
LAVASPEAKAEETKAEETPEEPEAGIRIDGKVYEGPSDFTLGEAQYMRAHCELTPQDVILGAERDPTDPDVIQAISWVVLHRINPKVEWDDVPIEKINVGDFWVIPEPKGGQRPPGSRRKRSS